MSEELKMPVNTPEFTVGIIGNCYGDLRVKVVDGQAYWDIDGFGSINWEKIPDYLYFALVKFEGENK
jgi:hypothetical protein